MDERSEEQEGIRIKSPLLVWVTRWITVLSTEIRNAGVGLRLRNSR